MCPPKRLRNLRQLLGAVALAAPVAACNLILDDPAKFEIESTADTGHGPDTGGHADLRVGEDQFVGHDQGGPAPDAGPHVDARATDARATDGTPRADARPSVDAGRGDATLSPDGEATPPDAFIPPPDACVVHDEICNGLDDDCDGQTDESDPNDCVPCGIPGRMGVCGLGAFACVEGQLVCVPQLPDPAVTQACNAQDDNCDGRIDEAGDVPAPADPQDAALLAHCGARPESSPSNGACEDGTFGCGPVHICVDPACRTGCLVNLSAAEPGCDTDCPENEPDRGVCIRACRDGVQAVFGQCLSDCGGVPRGGADRWTCDQSPGGPICTAARCPENTHPSGDRCVPDVEICNNGLDDDHDGLIDGVLNGPDPCAASFDVRGTPTQMGRCAASAPGTPCEDADSMRKWAAGSDELGSHVPGVARMVDLTYKYAVDKEEVSNRAYAECVAKGCCLAPVGTTYPRAVQALQAGQAGPRPENPDGCAPSVDQDGGLAATQLPDLPVTGVTWCMARDYCNWVGKRIPTEFEWEHAAAGPSNPGDARRELPWGPEPAPACVENACCRGADYAGALPAACQSGRVAQAAQLSVCDDGDPPAGTRPACLATYAKENLDCGGQVYGPAPVYANVDGATPEGVLNMSGNVGEWVYDWPADDLSNLSTTDPIGAGCDSTVFGDKRSVRGRDFTSQDYQLRSIDRFAMWDSARSPTLGFRCGRTVPDDGSLCDPMTPQANRVRCMPGADALNHNPGLQNLPACAAPDFNNQDPTDLAACGGLPRQDSAFCDGGLTHYCPSDTPTSEAAGCGSFIITHFELPGGLVGESDAVGLLNAVFASSLLTNGGSTILTLALDEAFGLQAGNWSAHFGSGDIDAQGRLVWLGGDDSGVCTEYPYGDFEIRTLNQRRELVPVCHAVTHSEIHFREAPVSLAFSALAMEGTYEPIDDTITGSMVLVMARGDLIRLQLGSAPTNPDAVAAALNRIGVTAQTLCGVPLGRTCFGQPLYMPGCDNNFQCPPGEEGTCTGWALPFAFEAVRANKLGIRNLRACPAPAP